jgi:hypothetical protein
MWLNFDFKQLVSYSQALKLRKFGFNEPCRAIYAGTNRVLLAEKPIYDNSTVYVAAPTYYEAKSWLREKFGVKDIVAKNEDGDGTYCGACFRDETLWCTERVDNEDGDDSLILNSMIWLVLFRQNPKYDEFKAEYGTK